MNLSEFSNIAVAVATGALAFATFVTNRRMREQFISMHRPYVRAHLMILGSSAITLRISNEGNASAENLTMKIDRDFFVNAEQTGKLLNSASAFSRPIKAMPAKTSWEYFLGLGPRLLNPELSPQEFSIAVRYEFQGETFSETLQIDLDAFRGTGTVSLADPTTDALKSLARSAVDISKQLASITPTKD